MFGSKSPDDKVMGSFILSEIRDLRKGMEGRDSEIRGEMAAVRDAVATLSESVSQSHTKVDVIQSDLVTMSTDINRLRKDVDGIQSARATEQVKQQSEWNGPKKVISTIALLASGATGIVVLATFWPKVVQLLSGG